MVRRAAQRALFATALAVAGALLGAAAYWWVVQPSDSELIAAARAVDLPGFEGPDKSRITGAWAPSFTRGVVHWDAASTTPLTESASAVTTALDDQGWLVTQEPTQFGSGDVVATRPGLMLTVHLRAASDSETEGSVTLRRGSTAPTLNALVVAGALVGAAAGAALMAARAHGRPGRRRADETTMTAS